MKANWSRYSAVHSTLAPQSISTAPSPSMVGITGARAARRMPLMRLVIRVAAESRAPVLPAETMASPTPSRSRFRATVREESFFSRKALEGLSSMLMTWSAWTISTPRGRSV